MSARTRRSRSAGPAVGSQRTRSASRNGDGDGAGQPAAAAAPEYEFGGPVGAVATMLGLPVGTLALGYLASQPSLTSAISSLRSDGLPSAGPGSLPAEAGDYLAAAAVVVGWLVFQAVLERVLPAEVAEGCPLPPRQYLSNIQGVLIHDGKERRLKYRMNGHVAFWFSLLAFYALAHQWRFVAIGELGAGAGGGGGGGGGKEGQPLLPISSLYDMHGALVLCTIAVSTALSVYLYVSSFAPLGDGRARQLAHGGTTGNAPYDFFMGRELNPRVLGGSFDLKVFCELRPGLIGWVLINACMAAKQYELSGAVSGSMCLVNVFQALYVWDALHNERAILSTMDVTTEGFGYMLAVGDLLWVPFAYSLQSLYLVRHDPRLQPPALLAIALLNGAGYAVFRGSNSQKDAFRRDPHGEGVRHLRYLDTARGTRLLTSGWWGLARKVNYTGDLMMAVAWCLPCGFGSVVPYFYAVYLAGLLAHRSMRDDEACARKYGADWLRYKQAVPYRFIPYVL